jgi:hypothetical protein
MCEPKLSAISKVCGKTYIKGIKPKIFLTNTSEITAIPAPTAGTSQIDTPVTFRAASSGPPAVAAGQWWPWEISKIDGTYKAEPNGDDDNPTILHTVEFFIYGLDPAKTYTVGQTLGHEFILVVPDNNGNNRLLGELTRGVTMKITEQTNDKNGYKGIATWEAGYYANYYPQSLPS